jgi:HK97 family phage portal protein
MGLFQRIWAGLQQKASTIQPLIYLMNGGGVVSPSRDPRQIAKEGYQANAIVYRCVSLTAQTVASIPVGVFVKGERVENQLSELLRRPNPSQGYGAWMQDLVSFLALTGNSYTEGLVTGGKIKELWVHRTDRMKIKPGRFGVAQYIYEAGGQSKAWDVDPVTQVSPIMHVKYWNPLHDWYGQSPIEAAANCVDQHNLAGAWNQSLLQNSARPSGILQYEGRLTEAQYEKLKSEVSSMYEGSRNAGRPMLAEQGLKFVATQLNALEMDWINGRNMSAREIALVFNIAPQMLGIPGDSTYSNYQEARQALYEDLAMPLLDFILDDFNAYIAPLYKGMEVRKIVDDIPALAAKRQARWATIAGADFMTANEKREAVGLPRVDARDANMLFINPALIPVGPAPGALSSQEEGGTEEGEPDMPETISKDKLDMILSVLEKLKAGSLSVELARDVVAKIDPTFDLSKLEGPAEEEEPEEEPPAVVPPQVPPAEEEEEEEEEEEDPKA